MQATYEEDRNAFAVPAGLYPAILRRISIMRDKYNPDIEDIRFLFDIMSADNRSVEYRARKVYQDTADGSDELEDDLQTLKPIEEHEDRLNEDGIIDLHQFEGMEVDLVVATKKVRGYKDPFSEITGIYPRGTIIPEADENQ